MDAVSDVITIVSGLPRSGTSMMMKMLEAGGIEPVTDHVRGPDVDNPRGYYEYEIVKKIAEDTSWLPATRGRAFKMVAPLLRHLPRGYRYQVVFMRRDMSEMLRAETAKISSRMGQGVPQFGHANVSGVPVAMIDEAGNSMAITAVRDGVGEVRVEAPAGYSVRQMPTLPQIMQ